MPPSLLFAVAVLGLAHIWAALADRPRLALALKPVPVLLCLVWALIFGEGAGRAWIVVGLALSALGDVFLGLPRERFLAGLVAFLLAHLAYCRAFLLRSDPAGTIWLLVGLAIYMGGILRAVLPGTGRLKGPVIGYVGVIAAMVFLAGEGWLADPSPASSRAFLGAVLFMISDSILAIHRFVRPVPGRKIWVMATYYGAQVLIASSCVATDSSFGSGVGLV